MQHRERHRRLALRGIVPIGALLILLAVLFLLRSFGQWSPPDQVQSVATAEEFDLNEFDLDALLAGLAETRSDAREPRLALGPNADNSRREAYPPTALSSQLSLEDVPPLEDALPESLATTAVGRGSGESPSSGIGFGQSGAPGFVGNSGNSGVPHIGGPGVFGGGGSAPSGSRAASTQGATSGTQTGSDDGTGAPSDSLRFPLNQLASSDGSSPRALNGNVGSANGNGGVNAPGDSGNSGGGGGGLNAPGNSGNSGGGGGSLNAAGGSGNSGGGGGGLSTPGGPGSSGGGLGNHDDLLSGGSDLSDLLALHIPGVPGASPLSDNPLPGLENELTDGNTTGGAPSTTASTEEEELRAVPEPTGLLLLGLGLTLVTRTLRRRSPTP